MKMVPLHHRYPGCVCDRPDPDLHRPRLRLREALQLVKLSAFDNVQLFKVPRFTFLGMFGAYKDATSTIGSASDVLSLFVLFAPVAFIDPGRAYRRPREPLLHHRP